MDSLITAAARALAAGDPVGALNRIALRDDAPAPALRGVAMARVTLRVFAKMEGDHQYVHRDHSTQRWRILRGRAEHIWRATTKNARK